MEELGKCVLLVDNDEAEMELLSNAFTAASYKVLQTYGGGEALECIARETPDIIVSDVDIPDMNGFDLCREIRGQDRLAHVPFVFISIVGKEDEDTLQGLRLGADDFVNRPILPDEVVLRADAILRRLRILRQLTITDEVTGLYNRRFFDQRLDEEVERLTRYNHPLAVFVVDCDNFKSINDTYGHAAGDHVLRVVAGCMEKQLRNSDILARYGGDEFAVIMIEHAGDSIEETAERLRSAVCETEIRLDSGGSIMTTVSIGGVWLDGDSSYSRNDVIRGADRMLYDAKKSGRNCLQLTSL